MDDSGEEALCQTDIALINPTISATSSFSKVGRQLLLQTNVGEDPATIGDNVAFGESGGYNEWTTRWRGVLVRYGRGEAICGEAQEPCFPFSFGLSASAAQINEAIHELDQLLSEFLAKRFLVSMLVCERIVAR